MSAVLCTCLHPAKRRLGAVGLRNTTRPRGLGASPERQRHTRAGATARGALAGNAPAPVYRCLYYSETDPKISTVFCPVVEYYGVVHSQLRVLLLNCRLSSVAVSCVCTLLCAPHTIHRMVDVKSPGTSSALVLRLDARVAAKFHHTMRSRCMDLAMVQWTRGGGAAKIMVCDTTDS